MSAKELAEAVSEAIKGKNAAYYQGPALVSWLNTAEDSELVRINVFDLAEKLRVEGRRLLETFVRLTKDGLFDLNWDFHCTTCNAVAVSHRHMAENSGTDHCPLCNVEFRNTLDTNVEVTFTPSERLYRVDPAFLERMMAETAALHAEGGIKLPRVFVSGLDCLHVPLFREMFETETLSLRESLGIKQVCLMFTDIKGSTELYDRFGDSAAYGLVRDHFELLFDRVQRRGGVVVKTIGDAVMASFRHSADGVAAAADIRAAFLEFNKREGLRGQILVKVGLHAGPAIMVNLNNRTDYFGQTVNLAARIQGVAEGGEVIVSEAVARDGAVPAVLRPVLKSLGRRVVELKGISKPQTIYRLNFVDS